MIGALIGVSMPIFWLGLMLIMVFSVILDWFPTGGRLGHDVDLEVVTNLYLIDSIITFDCFKTVPFQDFFVTHSENICP